MWTEDQDRSLPHQNQGVTKRCRLSWQTNSALVYEHECGGEGGGSCGVSANGYRDGVLKSANFFCKKCIKSLRNVEMKR